MNQSEHVAFSMSRELIIFFAKIQGAGAATAPVRCPTTVSSTSFKTWMHASNNYVSLTATDIATSATGVYTAKLRDVVPEVLDIIPKVIGTDGKQVQVTDYNPTTGVISFQTFTKAGVAVDLATTDFVTFTILGQKNLQVY